MVYQKPAGVDVDLAKYSNFPRNISALNTYRGFNSFNKTIVVRGEILYLNELREALEEFYKKCEWYALTIEMNY